MTLRRYTKIDRIISLFNMFGINRNHIRMDFAHIMYYFTVSSKQAETFQRHKANFFLSAIAACTPPGWDVEIACPESPLKHCYFSVAKLCLQTK